LGIKIKLQKTRLCKSKFTLNIVNDPKNKIATPKKPLTENKIPGNKNSHLGLYESRNLKCLQPSLQVLKCGGLDLPSGFGVIGTSVIV